MPISNQQFQQAADTLTAWKRPLLISHERPDGDALGCLLAMQNVLRELGRAPQTVLFDPCPRRYRHLGGASALPVLDNERSLIDEVDGVLCMDTASYGQVQPLADWLRADRVPLVVLDHHITRDLHAHHWLVDESASAASLIVYDWIQRQGWPMSPATREALFTGITTDTGWFRYSNTTPHALRAAAELVASGVDPDISFRQLYMTDSITQLRLRAAALARLELHCADRVALQTLRNEDFASTGATPADTGEVVNAPMSAERVEVAGLLVETGDGIIKCSLRSKGSVDVAALAARHGGGGHPRAAGVRIQGSLDEARDALVKDLTDQLASPTDG